jgi:DHA1 family bicyclomycin/chloramphenicol resistance-like MFS transporter
MTERDGMTERVAAETLASEAGAEGAAAVAKAPLGVAELVALIALLVGLNALAINIMLPALGDIGEAFAIANDNDRQLVVVVYLLAAGIAQLAYGPLMDRFGRRPVLLGALAGYLVGSLLCVVATSFSLLLFARAFQGLTTAAARVVSLAIVRDLSSGRRMAEIMSLVTSVFMLVPILAPILGQAVLLVGPWRWVFVALLVYGLVMAAWSFVRVPETLAPENRVPLRPGRVAEAYLTFLRTPVALGYTLACACMFGGYFGFISSSEQIFVETFALGARFPLAFAAVSLATTAATLVNARLVGRYGMRRLCHFAMIAATVINVVHALIAMAMGESLAVFLILIGLSFFFSGLTLPNFSALALEPLGRIAGTASSAFGFMTTTLSALMGGLIGRFYDGSATPVVLGFAGLGGLGILIVLVTEKGRLFQSGAGPHEPSRI